MLFVVCVSLLIQFAVTHAQQCTFVGNGVTYDFTKLVGTQYNATDAMGVYVFKFAPCSNSLQGPAATPCSVLQEDLQGNPVAPVSIFDNTLQWSVFSQENTTGVQFTTANGAPPVCGGSQKPRFATIQFVCSSEPPALTVINEPNLSGCGVAPGYVLQLTTPYACANPPPPPSSCPYTLQTPCTITTYNAYAIPGGQTIIFNQNGNQCGSLIFSDYVVKQAPADSCSSASMAGSNGSYLMSHLDILTYPKIVQMLQAGSQSNPVIFFWDQTTDSGAIGPTVFTQDPGNFVIGNARR